MDCISACMFLTGKSTKLKLPQVLMFGFLQLRGIGNSVNILQGDIPACGPSVVHITDNALLPLMFAEGPSMAPVSQQG